MYEFKASLLRERIIFEDMLQDGSVPENQKSGVVLSNRFDLVVEKDGFRDDVVIRAKSIHLTLRYVSLFYQKFYGSVNEFDHRSVETLETLWTRCLSDHDELLMDDLWCVVYINGEAVFQTKRNFFMDVIEKCALKTKGDYTETLETFDVVMKRLGREYSISHVSNVAAQFEIDRKDVKCSLLSREDHKTKVSSIYVEGGETEKSAILRNRDSFLLTSYYLEAVNIQKQTRVLKRMRSEGHSEYGAQSARQLKSCIDRFKVLKTMIKELEDFYAIKYRPEPPINLKH